MRNTKVSFTNGDTLDLTFYSLNSKLSTDKVLVYDWGNLAPISEDDPERVTVFKQNINYITGDTNTKGE